MENIKPYKIELKKVAFAYPDQDLSLKDVSFVARPGEVLALMAQVGGAKSTLLKICSTLFQPSEGEVLIDGRNVWQIDRSELNVIRRSLGYYFEEPTLISNMSVFDNLALPFKYHYAGNDAEIRRTVNLWLERLGLLQCRNCLPATITIGQRRRVGFARTVLLGDSFLFWDEPTHGADGQFAELVISTILERKKAGIGSIVATQSESVLNRIVDRAVVLENGKVGYYGSLINGAIPKNILAEDLLERTIV